VSEKLFQFKTKMKDQRNTNYLDRLNKRAEDETNEIKNKILFKHMHRSIDLSKIVKNSKKQYEKSVSKFKTKFDDNFVDIAKPFDFSQRFKNIKQLEMEIETDVTYKEFTTINNTSNKIEIEGNNKQVVEPCRFLDAGNNNNDKFNSPASNSKQSVNEFR